MKLSLTKQLLIDIGQKPIGKHDFIRVGEHVLDWLACASLGANSPAADAYKSLFSLDSGGVCSVVGASVAGHTVSIQNALQYNGALGNVLEMDDLHRASILHPGPVIIPAALAVAEQTGSSTTAFLTAILKGYEVTIRLGEAIGRSHYQYFHNTATCGAIGAAVAAASLLTLSQQQTLWAMGNAVSTAGGLWQMRNEKVQTKQWHNAEACRAGVMAAWLAKNGLSGPEYILEGPQGMFNALSDDASASTFINPSPDWRIHACSLKPWPACRHAHGSIDVLVEILKQYQLDVAQIERIEVGVYRDAQLFCDRVTPHTSLEAKFSIQHALSAILMWGEPALSHYEEAAYNNSDCAELRHRIDVKVDEQIEALYPQHYGATCTLFLTDGSTITRSHQDTLGDPQRPLNSAQRQNKVYMLLSQSGMDDTMIANLCQFDWLQSAPISDFSALLRYSTSL